jgi:hypothetical protein
MGCPGPCPHPRLEESHRRRVPCCRFLRPGAMPRARCPGLAGRRRADGAARRMRRRRRSLLRRRPGPVST